MKRAAVTFVFIFFAFSLVSAQTREERKQAKQDRIQNQYEAAKEVITNGQFSFRSYWMNTNGGKRIEMDAGSGYLTINDNNTRAYFPYFGTVRVATMYEGGGIEFNDEMSEYEVKFNDERKIIIIEFKVSAKKERYEVLIQLHKGLSGSVTVFSNKRDQISYDGVVKELEQ